MEKPKILLKLPINCKDSKKLYSMPNPDALIESYSKVRDWRFNGGADPTEEEIAHVLMLARGYLDLTTYSLGQTCCVGKLKDIWRARRAGATNGEV